MWDFQPITKLEFEKSAQTGLLNLLKEAPDGVSELSDVLTYSGYMLAKENDNNGVLCQFEMKKIFVLLNGVMTIYTIPREHYLEPEKDID